ncbi:MAG: conjugal transfer protein TraH [Siculibacillus sp.]|nr:conjugal transfer protein TraH [Siculibacillus sp.]
MVDAALVHACADPALKPAIVERFLEKVGTNDPLALSIRAGSRVILVPPAKTPDEALALVRRFVGEAEVRVGITRYPAGVGVKDPPEIGVDLFEPCANLRLGSALFGKVWRIVVNWYGAAVPEAFDDAVLAWRTGTFEGKAVFVEPDPGPLDVTSRDRKPSVGDEEEHPPSGEPPPRTEARGDAHPTEPRPLDEDPRRAAMRIDLTGAGRTRRP